MRPPDRCSGLHRDPRMSVLPPPTADLVARPPWKTEALSGLATAAALLPLMLTLGLIVFSATGAPATQLGLTAAMTAFVVGGLLMIVAGRAQIPAAAPSAPTSLILGALVARLVQDPAIDPSRSGSAATLLALTGATVICTGLLFGLLGLLRLGSLVRFVPQPVLAGFMNGVAVLIILSQLPPLLGIAPGAWGREGWSVLGNAHVGTVVVGLCTAAAVLAIQRRSPRAPAALLAMLGGLLVGEAVRRLWPAVHLPSLGTLLPILPAPDALAPLWTDAVALLSRHGRDLAVTALLLALIGGLESVLSMAAIDQLTNGRTDPNRELLALSVANLASGALGGMPLVYLRLRAITTLNSGGRSPRAVAVASVAMALAAVFALPVIERVPAAVLAGIVLTLGLALVDRWTRQLIDQWRAGEATADLRFSLLIVAVVCGVTLVWGFVAGVGAGTLLAMVVFIRTLNHSLLRNRFTVAEIPSRRVYPASLEALLKPLRAQAEVIELEGALFFGNADRLATEADRVRPDLAYLIVDFRRVTTIDASGAVGLAQLKERLGRRGVALLLAGVTRDNRHGGALQAHGVFRDGAGWDGFADADHAIEAAEMRLLQRAGHALEGLSVELPQCALFEALLPSQRDRLLSLMKERRLQAGERLFAQGDAGSGLFVVTSGSVSVVHHASAQDGGHRQRFISFSPGMTFGETAVLDGGGRTADAVADVDGTVVHELPAAQLRILRFGDPDLAAQLYRNLALHLSERLRGAAAAWRRAAA